MKKVLNLIACLALCAAFTLPIAAASGINAEEQKILNTLTAGVNVNGKMVMLDASYMNAAENYLNSDGVSITADQASVVVNQIEAAKKVLVDNNITDLTKVSKKLQDQIIAYSKTAAEELGLTLVADYTSKKIIIKDASGKVIFTVSKVKQDSNGNTTFVVDGDIIKNTGDDYTQTFVITGTIALLIASAGIIAARKGLFVKE